MRIIERQKSRLKISLSHTEIVDYFGSICDIRYDNPKARAVLGNLLISMTDDSFLKNSKKLTIKVFPEARGGCTIYFIASPKAQRYRRVDSTYILEFSGCEELLAACDQLRQRDATLPCSIYENGGRYRLMLCSEFFTQKIMYIALEYAERLFFSIKEKEKTREHWQTICQNTPVKTVCGLQ